MNGEAQELRQLAREIQDVLRASNISSIAATHVHACCDYLALLAHNMELTAQLDERRASKCEPEE